MLFILYDFKQRAINLQVRALSITASIRILLSNDLCCGNKAYTMTKKNDEFRNHISKQTTTIKQQQTITQANNQTNKQTNTTTTYSYRDTANVFGRCTTKSAFETNVYMLATRDDELEAAICARRSDCDDACGDGDELAESESVRPLSRDVLRNRCQGRRRFVGKSSPCSADESDVVGASIAEESCNVASNSDEDEIPCDAAGDGDRDGVVDLGNEVERTIRRKRATPLLSRVPRLMTADSPPLPLDTRCASSPGDRGRSVLSLFGVEGLCREKTDDTVDLDSCSSAPSRGANCSSSLEFAEHWLLESNDDADADAEIEQASSMDESWEETFFLVYFFFVPRPNKGTERTYACGARSAPIP